MHLYRSDSGLHKSWMAEIELKIENGLKIVHKNLKFSKVLGHLVNNISEACFSYKENWYLQAYFVTDVLSIILYNRRFFSLSLLSTFFKVFQFLELKWITRNNFTYGIT